MSDNNAPDPIESLYIESPSIGLTEFRNRLQKLSERSETGNKELIGLIDEITDVDPCEYDHSGNCQAHYYFGEGTCPVKRAQLLLEKAGVR